MPKPSTVAIALDKEKDFNHFLNEAKAELEKRETEKGKKAASKLKGEESEKYNLVTKALRELVKNDGKKLEEKGFQFINGVENFGIRGVKFGVKPGQFQYPIVLGIEKTKNFLGFAKSEFVFGRPAPSSGAKSKVVSDGECGNVINLLISGNEATPPDGAPLSAAEEKSHLSDTDKKAHKEIYDYMLLTIKRAAGKGGSDVSKVYQMFIDKRWNKTEGRFDLRGGEELELANKAFWKPGFQGFKFKIDGEDYSIGREVVRFSYDRPKFESRSEQKVDEASTVKTFLHEYYDDQNPFSSQESAEYLPLNCVIDELCGDSKKRSLRLKSGEDVMVSVGDNGDKKLTHKGSIYKVDKDGRGNYVLKKTRTFADKKVPENLMKDFESTCRNSLAVEHTVELMKKYSPDENERDAELIKNIGTKGINYAALTPKFYHPRSNTESAEESAYACGFYYKDGNSTKFFCVDDQSNVHYYGLIDKGADGIGFNKASDEEEDRQVNIVKRLLGSTLDIENETHSGLYSEIEARLKSLAHDAPMSIVKSLREEDARSAKKTQRHNRPLQKYDLGEFVITEASEDEKKQNSKAIFKVEKIAKKRIGSGKKVDKTYFVVEENGGAEIHKSLTGRKEVEGDEAYKIFEGFKKVWVNKGVSDYMGAVSQDYLKDPARDAEDDGERNEEWIDKQKERLKKFNKLTPEHRALWKCIVDFVDQSKSEPNHGLVDFYFDKDSDLGAKPIVGFEYGDEKERRFVGLGKNEELLFRVADSTYTGGRREVEFAELGKEGVGRIIEVMGIKPERYQQLCSEYGKKLADESLAVKTPEEISKMTVGEMIEFVMPDPSNKTEDHRINLTGVLDSEDMSIIRRPTPQDKKEATGYFRDDPHAEEKGLFAVLVHQGEKYFLREEVKRYRAGGKNWFSSGVEGEDTNSILPYKEGGTVFERGGVLWPWQSRATDLLGKGNLGRFDSDGLGRFTGVSVPKRVEEEFRRMAKIKNRLNEMSEKLSQEESDTYQQINPKFQALEHCIKNGPFNKMPSPQVALSNSKNGQIIGLEYDNEKEQCRQAVRVHPDRGLEVCKLNYTAKEGDVKDNKRYEQIDPSAIDYDHVVEMLGIDAEFFKQKVEWLKQNPSLSLDGQQSPSLEFPPSPEPSPRDSHNVIENVSSRKVKASKAFINAAKECGIDISQAIVIAEVADKQKGINHKKSKQEEAKIAREVNRILDDLGEGEVKFDYERIQRFSKIFQDCAASEDLKSGKVGVRLRDIESIMGKGFIAAVKEEPNEAKVNSFQAVVKTRE